MYQVNYDIRYVVASVPGPLLNSPYHKYKTFEKKSDAILFCERNN